MLHYMWKIWRLSEQPRNSIFVKSKTVRFTGPNISDAQSSPVAIAERATTSRIPQKYM